MRPADCRPGIGKKKQGYFPCLLSVFHSGTLITYDIVYKNA